MAPSCLAKQTTGRELSQARLVKLSIDVAAFCDTVQLKFNFTLTRKDTRAFASFLCELLNIS